VSGWVASPEAAGTGSLASSPGAAGSAITGTPGVASSPDAMTPTSPGPGSVGLNAEPWSRASAVSSVLVASRARYSSSAWARAAPPISSRSGGAGGCEARKLGRILFAREPGEEALDLRSICLHRALDARDLTVGDRAVALDMTLELLAPGADPALGLVMDPADLRLRPVADPVHVLVRELPEPIGFGGCSSAHLLKLCPSDAFDSGGDPFAFRLRGRAHGARKLVSEILERSGMIESGRQIDRQRDICRRGWFGSGRRAGRLSCPALDVRGRQPGFAGDHGSLGRLRDTRWRPGRLVARVRLVHFGPSLQATKWADRTPR
jgi:hypothetical protein